MQKMRADHHLFVARFSIDCYWRAVSHAHQSMITPAHLLTCSQPRARRHQAAR
jgi:hypothetical protein